MIKPTDGKTTALEKIIGHALRFQEERTGPGGEQDHLGKQGRGGGRQPGGRQRERERGKLWTRALPWFTQEEMSAAG